MGLSLIQYLDADGVRRIAALNGDGVPRTVSGVETVLELAKMALAAGRGLADEMGAAGLGEVIDLAQVTLLAPIDHPDTAHLLLTGTGLTHLGSAGGSDQMHRAWRQNPR